jgi:spore maturation protein CgeB
MKIILFCPSFTSCWNHGNRHFLRGVARVLVGRGHQVVVYEPEDDWSRLNALGSGAGTIGECAALVPGVAVHPYQLPTLDLDQALDGADIVIAHDQNDPDLIIGIGKRRLAGGRFELLFHDTHHSAAMPDELDRFDLDNFDAILVSGNGLRQAYARRGWGRRAATWHAAADTALCRPQHVAEQDTDVIWIGSHDNDATDDQIDRFLIQPVSALGLRARIYDARCPQLLHAQPSGQDITYGGWLLDQSVPVALAHARAVIGIAQPASPTALAGVPTQAMFEALACGTPLIMASWEDSERLFHAGSFLTVGDSDETAAALDLLLEDRDLAAEMANVGRCSVLARHTCEHRVDELLTFIDTFAGWPRSDSAEERPRLSA